MNEFLAGWERTQQRLAIIKQESIAHNKHLREQYGFDLFGTYTYFPIIKKEYSAPIIEENSVCDELIAMVEKEDECEIICYPETMRIFLEDVVQEKFVETFEEPIIEEIKQMENVEDTKSAGLIVQLKELQSRHVYVDPYLLHFTPLYFVINDFFALKVKLYKRMITTLFTSLLYRVVIPYVGLLKYVGPRLIFDPGRFEDESFTTARD